jgi:tetratricopeptide (TPR) repeat protein
MLLHKAAATFEELGDPGGLRWAKGLLAWTRFQQGHSAEAEEMAEAVLADDRGGDRWAVGMMLILAGSVRLWTGRTLSAIERLDEARALFEEIHDDFGYSQASAMLGRALILAGQVDEGLAMVASMGRTDAPPLTEREFIVSVMAGLAATVQVGDLERSEHMLTIIPAGPADEEDVIVGDTERTTSVGLHRLQSGDVTGAVAVLSALSARLLPEIDPNLRSALALAHVAEGEIDEALAAADEVDAHDRASYLDRLTAGIARALALARRGDVAASTAAFDQTRAAADATEDRVTQTLVRLADATAATARGDADASERLADAERRLADLGMSDTAWRQAFALAIGVPA